MIATTERLSFENGRGQRLSAKLERPAGPVRAWALFAHCFTCSKDTLAVSRISRALGARGVAVVRFDFTGHGESEGDFSATHFSSSVHDILAAADYMRKELSAPELLIGHSLGGAAMIAAAGRIVSAKAVAVIGAPESAGHLASQLPESIRENGEAEVDIGGSKFTIRRSFLEDAEKSSLSEHLLRMQAALFILHSPQDAVVPFSHAQALFERAGGKKSLLSLEGADHMLTDRRDSEFVAEILAAWAERHAGGPERPKSVAKGVVRVEALGPKYAQRIRTSEHTVVADEARPIGEDAGMSPGELMLASLGACTSITLRMYAERKGWSLERVVVELAKRKTEAGEEVLRRIELAGELTLEQKTALMAIADKCPQFKALSSGVKVNSELV